jgi:hypothetical protein
MVRLIEDPGVSEMVCRTEEGNDAAEDVDDDGDDVDDDGDVDDVAVPSVGAPGTA